MMPRNAFLSRKGRSKYGLDAATARALAQSIIADAELIAEPTIIFRPQGHDETHIYIAQIDIQKMKECRRAS